MMPGTPNSSVKSNNPKPINIFYIWYTELCRRSNITPLFIRRVDKTRGNTVLDFVADRLKFEEWSPLINALRHDTSLHVINIRNRMTNYQFLHDVDTEDKARRTKRKYGFIWTDYMLNSFMKALTNSLMKTEVLTCLELDGLPLFSVYIEELMIALKKNNTLKKLSLANCQIYDEGCRLVCSYLQMIPNVESLNLSKCALSSDSGQYIGRLIKSQQINRYSASWHNSLRYAEPDTETMRGMRRITLNGNTDIGDVGLSHILDELEDDLWIKALDMQMCGITEKIANKLLGILNNNQSLQIADFRQNPDLNPMTIENVMEFFKQKASNNEPSLYWCNTYLSLTPLTDRTSSRRNSSLLTDRTPICTTHKTNGIVKDAKTTNANTVRRATNGCVQNNRSCNQTIHLNFEMKYEKVGRGETKNQNAIIYKRHNNAKQVNGINGIYEANAVNEIGERVMNKLKSLKSSNDPTSTKDPPNNTPKASPVRKKDFTKCANGINVFLNGIKNGYKIVHHKELNGASSATDMFKKLLGVTEGNEIEEASSDDEDDLISYCENYEIDLSEIRKNSSLYLKKNEISGSQISLFNYMEEYDDKPEISSNPKITTLKHHYRGKKNGIK